MIRTSANWEGKKVRKKKPKKNKNCISSSNEPGGDGVGLVLSSTNNSPPPAPVPAIASSSSCLVVPDVWCGPGIGLSTDAASVDCVVSRRVVSGRGKVDGEKINLREVCLFMMYSYCFQFHELDFNFGFKDDFDGLLIVVAARWKENGAS